MTSTETTKPVSQYLLAWYWLRTSGGVLLAMWLLFFLAIPVLDNYLNPGVDNAKAIGFGSAFGLIMIAMVWFAVAIQVGLWIGVVDYYPDLDKRYAIMLLYSTLLFLAVFRETVLLMPTPIFGLLSISGFLLPRLLHPILKRGVFPGQVSTAP